MATTGAEADEQLLAEVLWRHRRLSKHAVPAAVADATYGTTLNHLYLEHAGIPAFIPTTRFGNRHTGIWGREHFTWLPYEEAFLMSRRRASRICLTDAAGSLARDSARITLALKKLPGPNTARTSIPLRRGA